MLKKQVVFFILVFVTLFGCTAKTDTAGDFKLQDLDGKTIRLSDFKGKLVVLDFWASWCQPCRESIPSIEKLYEHYSGKGLVVLGISLDEGDWDSVRAFVRKNAMTYTVLKGTDDVISRYGVRTIPMLVIIDKQGKIVKRYLGLGSDDQLERDIKPLL